LATYQIEVLDFSKKPRGQYSDALVPDGRGVYRCRKCEWEGQTSGECPQCGNRDLYQKGKVKVVDTLPAAPRRTLVELFYGYKQAVRWASKFGSVISCRKVDKTRYLENIEHLNLGQEPVRFEVEQDYVLTRTFELERPRRSSSKKEFDIGGESA
jgi:hypothetical protein